MQPSYRLAGSVKSDLQPLHRCRVKIAMLDVVFAREGQLHRPPSHRLREDGRFSSEVRL
jgi:hypothetical protein